MADVKIASLAENTSPTDTNIMIIEDNSDTKKITFANIKATLKTYFDGLYATIANLNLKAPLANPTFTGTQTLPNIVTNGIKFPATQVPSADPNTLDDYEEGTWTPTLLALVVAGNHTYTVREGSYIKIGKMVYIKAKIVPSVLDGTWSGGVSISGLPFVAQNGLQYNPINLWHSAGITYPSGRTYLDSMVVPNSTTATLYAHGSNINHVALQTTNITGVGEITIGGFYIAND